MSPFLEQWILVPLEIWSHAQPTCAYIGASFLNHLAELYLKECYWIIIWIGMQKYMILAVEMVNKESLVV